MSWPVISRWAPGIDTAARSRDPVVSSVWTSRHEIGGFGPISPPPGSSPSGGPWGRVGALGGRGRPFRGTGTVDPPQGRMCWQGPDPLARVLPVQRGRQLLDGGEAAAPGSDWRRLRPLFRQLDA